MRARAGKHCRQQGCDANEQQRARGERRRFAQIGMATAQSDRYTSEQRDGERGQNQLLAGHFPLPSSMAAILAAEPTVNDVSRPNHTVAPTRIHAGTSRPSRASRGGSASPRSAGRKYATSTNRHTYATASNELATIAM